MEGAAIFSIKKELSAYEEILHILKSNAISLILFYMKTSRENKEMETKTATMFADEYGIVHLIIDYKNNLSMEDAKEILAGIKSLSNGEKAVILMKSLNYKLPPREVRAYPAGEDAVKVIKALAFIVTNPVTRIGVNFFLKVYKPSFPLGIFTDQKEAILWLKNFQA